MKRCIKESKLPKTSCNIPMPATRMMLTKRGTCETCIKKDVCALSGELEKATKEVKELMEHMGEFAEIDIKCKKWYRKESDCGDSTAIRS